MVPARVPRGRPAGGRAVLVAARLSRERLEIAWTFDTREDFEAVVRIELPTAVAEDVLAEHPDATGVDYAVNLWWRRY